MGNLMEFDVYLAHLCEVLGHVDRGVGLKDYCSGLMLPIKRKSIEPLAAHTDPLHVAAKHQSLHDFVAKSVWSDAAVMGRVHDWVLPTLGVKSGCYCEGSNAELNSRFAMVRVRPAHRDYLATGMRAGEWLLIEWPEGDVEPAKYFLSTVPDEATIEQLVFVAKMRWRVERDYQELKEEFGISNYEGRGWQGFHLHATLCITAYGFLVAQRLNQGDTKKNCAQPETTALPEDYIPRGSRTGPAACPELDSNTAISYRAGHRRKTSAMPLLR